MRGTGSADIAMTDLFILNHLIAPVGPLLHPAPGFEGAALLSVAMDLPGETTVSIGIAAAAIKQRVQLCQTKTASIIPPAFRDQQLVHYLMGKAQSRVSASRDTLHAAAAAAYEEVSRSNALLSSSDAKVRHTPAACFAVEACAEAVRFVDDVVGTSLGMAWRAV